MIREAFLRGISTRQVGRVVAVLTGETVSPQTVSRITQELDQAVRQFHQARLEDDWAYLFLDGVSLRVRRPAGPQAGANAGGLRGEAGWSARTVGLSAHARVRARRTGNLCSMIFPARLGGKAFATDCDRRLSWFGGCYPDRLSPGSASALLGAQDAQHPGESQKARL